uniref:Aa_trans domain-containing protein n=1 Tax=Heterorhabditis bacteriophora TaxID=37862 RepID=A0A1I7XJV3_HETBA
MVANSIINTKVKYKLGDQCLDYGEMAEVALDYSYEWIQPYKATMKYCVNGCLIAFQIGVSSVAFVFVIDHIQEILLYFNLADGYSKTELFLFYLIPATLINYVKSIKAVTFVCLIGNILMFVSIVMILGELFTSRHSWRNLPWITNFDGITLAAGTVLYSFEGQAMILPLENKLKYSSDMNGWTGVLTTGI